MIPAEMILHNPVRKPEQVPASLLAMTISTGGLIDYDIGGLVSRSIQSSTWLISGL